ncbi:MAG: hypothetical protein R3B84_13555 [Zavarzinella sp.]
MANLNLNLVLNNLNAANLVAGCNVVAVLGRGCPTASLFLWTDLPFTDTDQTDSMERTSEQIGRSEKCKRPGLKQGKQISPSRMIPSMPCERDYQSLHRTHTMGTAYQQRHAGRQIVKS